jgi:ribosomal-protein-alanine N-acetyltransferase
MVMQDQASKNLQSSRLYLQPVEATQAAAILAGDDPEGVHLAEGYPSKFTLEVMERLVSSETPNADTNFFIVRRADKRAIGGVGFWFPDGPTCPRVGYDIIESLWGQGFATEALETLRDFLFTCPGVEAVRADTQKAHLASRRVMEKAGLKLISEMPGEEDGQTVEMVLYEVRRISG